MSRQKAKDRRTRDEGRETKERQKAVGREREEQGWEMMDEIDEEARKAGETYGKH